MKIISEEEREQQLMDQSLQFINTAVSECKQKVLEALTELSNKTGINVIDFELEIMQSTNRSHITGIQLIFKK